MKPVVSVLMLVLVLATMPILALAQVVTPECDGLPADQWTQIQSNAFKLCGTATLVSDPAASNGQAAREDGSDNNWNVQYAFPSNLMGTWHCYVHVRCTSSGPSGSPAFTMGLADVSGYMNTLTPTLDGGVTEPNDNYQIYDLGNVTFNTDNNCYFFICPYLTVCTNVYIDRIVLVKIASPLEATGLAPSDWIDLHDDNFWYYPDASYVYKTADSAASGGWAAYETSTGNGPWLQYDVTASQVGTWNCYIHERCVPTAQTGWAFDWGVYPGKHQLIPINGVASDGEYHMYNLGIQDLTTESILWAAGSTATSAIYCDRMSLVLPTAQCTATMPLQSTGMPRESWIDLHQNAFVVAGNASLVADPDASNGCAAKELGSDNNWYVQCPVQPSETGTLQCYATLRTDAASTNPTFQIAIYDNKTGKLVSQNTVVPTDNQYHTYSLGIQNLTTDMMFFVGPSGLGPNAYLDRISLLSPTAQCTATTPIQCTGMSRESWIDLHQNAFVVTGSASLVADPNASNGCAAMELGSDNNWYVQCPVQPSETGTWQCCATLRTDAASTNPVFQIGLFDNKTGKIVSQNTVIPTDNQYHTYNLGIQNLTTDMMFFVGSSGSGPNIYLDRISLLSPTAHCAATTPLQCTGMPRESWIDLHQNAFVVTGSASLVADPNASNGCAAKELGTDSGWNVQCPIQPSETGTWQCYATLRTDAATTSPAFEVGLYDNAAGRLVSADTFKPADSQYHTYNLGVHNLTTNMMFFVGPSGNGPNVYVDRIFLVPVTSANSASSLRGLADGASVSLTSPVLVTTGPNTFTDGSVYVEDPSRSWGIRCVFDSISTQLGTPLTVAPAPVEGNIITVGGTLATDSTGERYLTDCGVLTASAGNAIAPIGAGAKSISQSKPDMSGILGRTWGKVTNVAPDKSYYYIDDGSGITDASGVATGLRVNLDGLVNSDPNVPSVGDFVTKTGIFYKKAVSKNSSNVVVPILQSRYCVIDAYPVVDNVLQPGFTLASNGGQLMDDPLFPGWVVDLPNSNPGQNLTYAVPVAGLWHCYATVAIDQNSTSGNAFSLGIYDPSVNNPAFPVSKTITVESGAGDGIYHKYDLGVQQLKPGDYFWFAANGIAPDIYVGKIELTRD